MFSVTLNRGARLLEGVFLTPEEQLHRVCVAGSDLGAEIFEDVTSLGESSCGEGEELVTNVSPRRSGTCNEEAR